MRSKNPRIIARELEFDRAVDSLWVFFRRFLELCIQAFGHPGLDQLTPERQAQVQLTKLREIAAMARSLHEQLFEAEGTNFTRSAFASQAESMAAILRIIKADQLDAGISAVLNDLIHPALAVCQQQYEDLVSERMRREIGVVDDFRELRTRLRWLLERYKVAVETLYDEDKPETFDVVEDALRSMIMVSAHMTRRSTPASEAELDAALVDSQFFDEPEADDEFGEQGDEGDGEDESDGLVDEDADVDADEDAAE